MPPHLTPDGLRATVAAILADARYQPGFGFLVDRRAAAPTSPAYARFAAQLAQQLGDQLVGARLAVVVPDTASFGAARRFQTYFSAQPVPMEIFCHPSEAEAWLRQAGGGPPPDGDARPA